LRAGLDHAAGACVITMDADLQHPPELIPEMLAQWRSGFEVVLTVRSDNECVSPLKRVTANLFYAFVNLISEVHIQERAADFRLLDRSVVEVLKSLREAPFYRGIIPWLGFRQTSVGFAPARRHAGRSKYSLARMISLALGGLVSFSVIPLRIASGLGFLMAVTGFIIGVNAVLGYLSSRTVPGWTSTIATIVLVGGVQLLILGIIGEYLGRLFIETKRRPHYIVRERSGGGARP
jgi:polyisoprenyl-phosphate glycosyltransferase